MIVPNLVMDGEDPLIMGHFAYLGSCASKDGNSAVEEHMRISKARAVHAGPKHSWRWLDSSLKLKGRACSFSVRALLLYGFEI